MNRPTCPYVGFKDDRSKVLPYPSKENLCHHARPIQPARGTYQYQYCLTPDHIACPLFKAAGPVPMPESIASPFKPAATRQMVALVAIPAVMVLIALLSFVWNAYGSRLFISGSIPGTGNSPFDDYGNNNSLVLAPTKNAASANNITLLTQKTKANCPMPSGWVVYTVNQSDSLFRLSAVYNVSLEELQQANCMGKSTVILPGQVLYVPDTPTAVAPVDLAVIPSPQSSPSPTLQVPTFQPTLFGPPTPTPPPAIVSRQPTSTLPPAVIFIPPAVSTNTSSPQPTQTPIPTSTPVPSSTVAPSKTPVPATPTTEPSRTRRPSSTPKPSPTDTQAPTNTSVPPPTDTPVPPPTNTPVPPPTDTPVPPPTNTPVPPPTNTPVPAPTETATTAPAVSFNLSLQLP